MPKITTTETTHGQSGWRDRGRRVLWLIAIWACSVAVLGVAAWGLRLVMRAIGMSPP